MNEDPRRILLARHGQTEWNKSYRFQGRTNIHLTEEGMHQAELLSLRLRSWPPEVVYTSPLDRAKYTADKIASRFGLSPVVIPELEEINFGSWEGESLISLEHDNPEAYNRWRSDPFFNPPEGGESWPEIEARLTRAVNIMLDSPHKKIIAVSHGGIMRALYAVIMGLDPHKTWYMDVSNCSMSGIEIANGRPYLSFTNDALHVSGGECGVSLPVWG
ncbi:MAG: histidine phosphatase family protein [Synergistaceae bacterium]|nr:histidine phosphatase family protein [Synergistaceae bacterium]